MKRKREKEKAKAKAKARRRASERVAVVVRQGVDSATVQPVSSGTCR